MNGRALVVGLSIVLAGSANAGEKAPAPTAGDPRCKDGISAAAKRFTTGTPAERYLELTRACSRDEVVELAKALIRFRTVSADPPAKKQPQFAAMAKFLGAFAKRHGFTFTSHGKHDVFEVSWGAGAAKAAFVFHGDVVPAPRHEWKKDPFKPVVEDGRLYGRGSEDDKGPLASALVSLAMAKAVGLEPDGRVLIIIGNGEEHDWKPMTEYAKAAPPIEYVISVDSTFPVVAAQSGFVAWTLSAKLDDPAATPQLADSRKAEKLAPPVAPKPMVRIVGAEAGEFLTQVPGRARMTLEPRHATAEEAEQLVRVAIEALARERKSLKVDVARKGRQVVVTAHGAAVHASVAEQGRNALWDLAALTSRLPVEANGIWHLLDVVAKRFDGDHFGGKLGVAYEDPLMGPLLVAPTLLRVNKKDGVVTLQVNMRRPRGRDAAQFAAMLDAAAKAVSDHSGGRITEVKADRYAGDPHLADVSGPLVTTLTEIYKQHRGGDDESLKPRSIRGGTYARLFPRAVDFGPAFPGEPYTGHAPDESISVDGLHQLTRMLSDALLRLAIKQPPP